MAKQYSPSGRVLRLEPVDGPRRLKTILRGVVTYYPTEAAAIRAWEAMVLKIMQVTPDDARATIVVDARETQKGWYLHGVIHPARIMWRRPLEDAGVYIEVGEKGPHWHRLTPKSHDELMEDLRKQNRGRTWL